jgi:hypothetical protein
MRDDCGDADLGGTAEAGAGGTVTLGLSLPLMMQITIMPLARKIHQD